MFLRNAICFNILIESLKCFISEPSSVNMWIQRIFVVGICVWSSFVVSSKTPYPFNMNDQVFSRKTNERQSLNVDRILKEPTGFYDQVYSSRVKSKWYRRSGKLVLEKPALNLNSLANIAQLGVGSSFRYLGEGKIEKTAKGVKRIRMKQTYNGLDVWGSKITAEMDAEENLIGQMYGSVIANIAKYIPNPDACQRKVKNLIKRAISLSGFKWGNKDSQEQNGYRLVMLTQRKN